MIWEPLLWLLLLVIVDFITGLIGHTMRDGFSSSKVREGLAHKFTYVIALVLCLILEKIMEYYELPMVYAGVLYSLTYVWIVVTETGSILENLVLINPDLADNSFMRIFDRREEADQITQPLPMIDLDDEECSEALSRVKSTSPNGD